MTETGASLAALLRHMPPPWAGDMLPRIAAINATPDAPKLVILDDDPTGTQTVRDVPVLTTWGVTELQTEFTGPHAGFFLLTNSRSLTREDTESLHREIARNLQTAAAGRRFTLISRGDSTLRGHFPTETDALAGILGDIELTVLAPFFAAGHRFTLHDTHYLADGDKLVPVAETPFARDPVFGYKHSRLPDWIEEKTGGAIRASQVHCLPLALLRHGGPDLVRLWLVNLPPGALCVVNAICAADIETFAVASATTELQGRRLLYRTAASFVAARFGQRPGALLEPAQMSHASAGLRGGLVIAGSFVPKTTAQLARLRERHAIHAVELPVAGLLDPAQRRTVIDRALAEVEAVLSGGRDVLLLTSRALVTGTDASANLAIGRQVSDALVAIARRLKVAPRFLIAKGGITSSDIATAGLGVRRAMVMGQLLPGVPVWRLGAEARFPGLPYVVFPGNVGDDDALAEAVTRLPAPV